MSTMNANRNYTEKMDNLRPTTVMVKLVWLAAQADTDVCRDLFEDMLNCSEPTRRLLELFPRLNAEDTQDLEDSLSEAGYLGEILTGEGYYGFIAEVHVPECYKFKYDATGRRVGWTTYGSISQVEYVYGETIEDLTEAIVRRTNEVVDEMAADERKKQAVQP